MTKSGFLTQNPKDITTIDAVVSQIDDLKKTLAGSEYAQFRLFNEAYHVVTSAILEARDNNYFDNPQFIEKFTVIFARKYFTALNALVNGSIKSTSPWSKMNRLPASKPYPDFIAVLLGANAHINHDLPLVLLELMEEQDNEELLGDIIKIDGLLMKCGRQIIQKLHETNRALFFLERKFQFLYYKPVMYMIKIWRIIAWRNYRKIRKNSKNITAIEKRCTRISKRLVRIGNIVS